MKVKLPEFTTVTFRDADARAWFDYDPGEEQWFDARAGVGSPGYPASLEVYKVEQSGVEVIPTEEEMKDIDRQISDEINAIYDAQYAERE